MSNLRPGIFEIFFTLNYQASYRNLWRAISAQSGGEDGARVGERAIRVTLSKLKQQGLLINSGGLWRVTAAGREYWENKILKRKHRKKLADRPKNMIIAFDIPEKYKERRHWLRVELKSLGFVLLQKSVWFGPAPLPQEFTDSLRETRILQYLKFFRAQAEEIV